MSDKRTSASVSLLLALLLPGLCGCSIKRVAVNKLGDALASGGNTFATDNDPELVKAAVPFSLKTIESLLHESPRHEGLLLSAASGFTQYAYAFVQEDADELEAKDLKAAEDLRVRARKLYLRARNYGLRGLEVKHAGFERLLRTNASAAVSAARKADVPLLYWTAVSWTAAISLAKDNPELIGEIPMAQALIDRTLELDESFDHGAIHSFLITYEMARQGASTSGAEARSRQHFARAVELSASQQAGPFVALAEAVSVQKQNAVEFKQMLDRALAINPDARPEWRLLNLIMQRRAKWLLDRSDDLFLNRHSRTE